MSSKIEEIKDNLSKIGLDLETFSEKRNGLMSNDIVQRYKELQELKVKFDEQKYKNSEYYDKLEFKSIVINNKIKNIINTKQKWLLEKNKLIKYYKKEIKIAEKYEEINTDIEKRLREIENFIKNKLEEEGNQIKHEIIKERSIDYVVILVSLLAVLIIF